MRLLKFDNESFYEQCFVRSEECKKNPKVVTLSVGPLLAQAVYNIHNKKSISALFK